MDNDSSVFGEATDQLTVTATMPETPPAPPAPTGLRRLGEWWLSPGMNGWRFAILLLVIAAIGVSAYLTNQHFPDCISNCQHP